MTKKNNLPVKKIDFTADAGRGFEDTKSEDFAIPFLVVLQSGSPQLKDGAFPGHIYNTITGGQFKAVQVVPVAYKRRYNAWYPRTKGGGFRGSFIPSQVEGGFLDNITQYEGRYFMDLPKDVCPYDKDGNPDYVILKDTRNHFVLFLNTDGVWQQALISLTSTQIKKSRRFMTLMQSVEFTTAEGVKFIPPTYSHIYEMSVVDEQNNKGKWFGVSFKCIKEVDSPDLYEKAKTFHTNIMDDNIVISEPIDDTDGDDF